MASTVYADCQQLCDYALLKHVDIGKDADAPDKLYKVGTCAIWELLLQSMTTEDVVKLRLLHVALRQTRRPH